MQTCSGRPIPVLPGHTTPGDAIIGGASGASHGAAVLRDAEVERWGCEQLAVRAREAHAALSGSGRMFYTVGRARGRGTWRGGGGEAWAVLLGCPGCGRGQALHTLRWSCLSPPSSNCWCTCSTTCMCAQGSWRNGTGLRHEGLRGALSSRALLRELHPARSLSLTACHRHRRHWPTAASPNLTPFMQRAGGFNPKPSCSSGNTHVPSDPKRCCCPPVLQPQP